MSPVSRNRKKKPGQVVKGRRSLRLASPYAPILTDAERLLDEKSMLVVEQWASHLWGTIWTLAWADEDVDPEDNLEVHVEALVEYMVAEGTPVALCVLRALATVGENWMRELAGQAGDVLAARGVPEPVWHRGEDAHLASAYAMSEPFGEVEPVVLGFDRDGTRHAVLVFIAHVGGSHIARIMVGNVDTVGVDAILAAFRDDAPFSGPVPLSGAQARARLEEPLGLLLDGGPQDGGPLDEIFDGVDGDPAAGWALLRARLDPLPDDPDLLAVDDLDEGDDGEQIASAFLASEYAEGLPDRTLARLWGKMAGDWALDSTGAAHRFGPLSLNFFLMAEMSQHVIIDETDLALLPDIIRAWAHFTADAGGLEPQVHQLWDEHLPVLLSAFAAAYADIESVTHRAQCPEVFDLREYTTPTADQVLLERFYEVMPEEIRGQLKETSTAAYPALAEMTDEATRTVYQIKVTLRGSRPPVWRRLLVAPTTTLTGLHEVIQAAFDWDDDHLWMFTTGYGRFGPTPDLGARDPDAACIAQIAGEGVKFEYLFDFGDDWDHQIIVEKVLPVADDTSYPVCVGGRQPDPVQYEYEYEYDDDENQREAFDKNLINTRLAMLAAGS